MEAILTALGIGGIGVILLNLLFGIIGAVLNLSLGLALMLIATVFGMLIRVFFMFVKAYLSIILLVLLGPLIIAFSALLPGDSGRILGWLKSLLANVLIFPAASLVITIGNLVIARFNTAPGNFWGPPMIGNDPGLLAASIGIGVLLILPEIEGLISKALGIGAMPIGAMPTPDIAGTVRKDISGGYGLVSKLATPTYNIGKARGWW